MEEVEKTTADGNEIIAFITECYPEHAEKDDAEKYAVALELLRKQKAFAEAMAEIYEREPELATIITQVVHGKGTMLQALAQQISPEELAELYNADGEDSVKSANERRKAFAAYKDTQAKIAANAEETGRELDAFIAEEALTDEQSDEFMKFAETLYGAIADGKITKKEWKMLYAMKDYDANLAAAQEEGIVRGRNEKIDAKRAEEQARRGTDGLPPIAGTGEMPADGEGKKLHPMVANLRKLHEARGV